MRHAAMPRVQAARVEGKINKKMKNIERTKECGNPRDRRAIPQDPREGMSLRWLVPRFQHYVRI
jgi:hypothetical protein